MLPEERFWSRILATKATDLPQLIGLVRYQYAAIERLLIIFYSPYSTYGSTLLRKYGYDTVVYKTMMVVVC